MAGSWRRVLFKVTRNPHGLPAVVREPGGGQRAGLGYAHRAGALLAKSPLQVASSSRQRLPLTRATVTPVRVGVGEEWASLR